MRVSQKDSMVIFHAKTGEVILRGDYEKETIWASQTEIVQLFGVDQSVVSRHIRNIFADKEIDQKSNMQKMHITNVDKPVIFYSLDVILGVGYRTNSKVAIAFRQWATKTLRQYVTKGYAMNKKRIAQNYDQFLSTINAVKALLPKNHHIEAISILELISAYADTWLSLEAYDTDKLVKKGMTKKQVELTAEKLATALRELKKVLVNKGEASELFGMERNQKSIEAIVGNVMQSFDRKDLYETIEEKAAHLLYFIVKDHPFADGNKRSGAYAFIWFLNSTGILNATKITAPALTALTLLIAESDSKSKQKMIRLVMQVLR